MSKLDDLYRYVANAAKVRELENEIRKISEDIETIDELLESTKSEAIIEMSAKFYNKLCEQKIKLELQKNKIEKEILLFELNSYLDE